MSPLSYSVNACPVPERGRGRRGEGREGGGARGTWKAPPRGMWYALDPGPFSERKALLGAGRAKGAEDVVRVEVHGHPWGKKGGAQECGSCHGAALWVLGLGPGPDVSQHTLETLPFNNPPPQCFPHKQFKSTMWDFSFKI